MIGVEGTHDPAAAIAARTAGPEQEGRKDPGRAPKRRAEEDAFLIHAVHDNHSRRE